MDNNAARRHLPLPPRGWIPTFFTYVIRVFIVSVVSIAWAIVTVAEDRIPESLFDMPLPAYFNGIVPLFRDQAQHDSPSGSRPNSAGNIEESVEAPFKGKYVVFVGKDVGITSRSSLASSLVLGIPNNQMRKYSSADEAIYEYKEALTRGDVRRVCLIVSPSGRTEFQSECLDAASGLRDLDVIEDDTVHSSGLLSDSTPVASGPIFAYSPGPDARPSTPRKPYSPVDWQNTIRSRPSSRNHLSGTGTITPSSESSVTYSSFVPTNGIPSALSRVLVLESDDDTDQSGDADGIKGPSYMQESGGNRSARSSDRYYTSVHEAQCVEQIKKEEEANGANISVEL